MFAVTGTAFSAAKRLTNDGKVRLQSLVQLGENAKLIGPVASLAPIRLIVLDSATLSLYDTLLTAGMTT